MVDIQEPVVAAPFAAALMAIAGKNLAADPGGMVLLLRLPGSWTWASQWAVSASVADNSFSPCDVCTAFFAQVGHS